MVLEIVGLLRYLGIFGIGAAVLAFVLRGLFTQMLSRDLEKCKIELQASHDKEIERLRADLKAVAFERETRFARLHERRAEVIAELYALLLKAEGASNLIFMPLLITREHCADEASIELRRKEYVAKTKEESLMPFWALTTYFDENRLYFDESFCKLMDEFNKIVREIYYEVTGYLADPNRDDNLEIEQKQMKRWQNAWSKTLLDLPNIRRQLENEFRELLGVGKEQGQ